MHVEFDPIKDKANVEKHGVRSRVPRTSPMSWLCAMIGSMSLGSGSMA
jgi:hypothetical protein